MPKLTFIMSRYLNFFKIKKNSFIQGLYNVNCLFQECIAMAVPINLKVLELLK